MNELLKDCRDGLLALLNTRTGFLGLGPTYGELIASAVISYGIPRNQEKSVVKEAEKILDDINARNRMF